MKNNIKIMNKKPVGKRYLALPILIMGVFLALLLIMSLIHADTLIQNGDTSLAIDNTSLGTGDVGLTIDNIKAVDYNKMSLNYPEITIKNSFAWIIPLDPILDTKINGVLI